MLSSRWLFRIASKLEFFHPSRKVAFSSLTINLDEWQTQWQMQSTSRIEMNENIINLKVD